MSDYFKILPKFKRMFFQLILLFLFIISNILTVQSDEHQLIPAEQTSTDGQIRAIQSEFNMILFQLYKDYISPVDGERCEMFPSCSSYGKEAVKKHGLFIGWIMTCDRLIRCGRDEKHIAERLPLNGKLLTIDPVTSNDFWWYSYDFSQ